MVQTPRDVDAYIAAAPKELQDKLVELRTVIREAAPTAMERISYSIPFYDYKGRLAYFRLAKTHIGRARVFIHVKKRIDRQLVCKL